MNEDEELVQAFLEESRENLDQMDRDLVELESRPADPDLLARVFRAVHTIKGTSGFLGLVGLEKLSHAGEDVLGELRSGRLVLDAAITTTLLRLVDEIRAVLDRLAAQGSEGDDDHRDLIDELAHHLVSERPGASSAAGRPDQVYASAGPPVASAEVGVLEAVAPASVPAPTDTTIRVDVEVLDRLQDLVGELTQASSRLGVSVRQDSGALVESYRQVQLLTRELQDGVMAARLQPIGTVVGKAHRIVRDLATALGKSVRVELTGEDVGVDRSVIEALRDPVTHLIRNAVDHGIEPPDERVRVGKPAEAVIRLEASLEAGRVRLDLSDDGRGINLDRLVERAVSLGVISSDEAAGVDDEGRIELMFRPGLSTREQATSVSGRGVGMDVVRANLDRIGGRIEVTTSFGLGSRFRLDLPLTLAIIPSVVVGCEGARYVIPQSDVHTILAVGAAEASLIDSIHDTLTYRWRGRLLPLVDLSLLLGVRVVPAPVVGRRLVVLRGHGRLFGLLVDEVDDTVDAVVKPLPTALGTPGVYSGVTILSDGEPALILDGSGIGFEAGILATALGDLDDRHADGPAATLLLATDHAGEQVAFPLAAVQHLVLVPATAVQRSGGIDVVPYGHALLPLVPVTTTSRRSAAVDPTSALWTVVCATSVGLVGLTIAHLDDVAPRPVAGWGGSSGRGVAGRIVVADRVTELLDIDELVADAGLVAR
jgi:two-component system chemotaxis sensor kinase CheA